jgi:hypothetical protein
MKAVAKPVISFLDNMYKPDSLEESGARAVADHVKSIPLAQLASRPTAAFAVTVTRRRAAKATVSVQYEAERSDIDRIRKHLKKPSMGANRIGEFTFNYYLSTECPE